MSISPADGPQKIGEALRSSSVKRRDFLKLCTTLLLTAPAGLALTSGSPTPAELASDVDKAPRLPVLWLSLQSCMGCSEALLRTSMPGFDELFLNLISLEYHPLLMASSGEESEKILAATIRRHSGRYLLVVEGAVPGVGQERYLTIAGRTGTEVLSKASAHAAAVIAMGSCASWGGIVSADPNPTGATGISPYVGRKTLINIPGCPPNPYVLIGTILEYAAMGRFPALDDQHRPLFAFDRTIHEHCPRRAHFEAGRITRHFGDAKHKKGYCLFGLGCKGPVTHAACPTRHFNEIPDCWPIGVGAPCFGCTEREIAFRSAAYQIVVLED